APHDLLGIQAKALTWEEKGIKADGHSYDAKYTRDVVLAKGRWYYVLPPHLRDPRKKGSCPSGGRLVIRKAAPPMLATRPRKPGEIILVGRATPRIYGPYSFPPGGFIARFQEFDPTRPKLEPTADGSRFMVALLARDRVPKGTPSRLILSTTAPRGAT